jgi:nucleoside-diphosphate-sugar epimerase
MLIGHTYLRGRALVLRDVDGSEQSMSIEDALDLLAWLTEHKGEIQERLAGSDDEITERLDALDSLELLCDEMSETMERTDNEREALECWSQLKEAQAQQADIKTALERMGYQVKINLEPHAQSHYSVSP